MQLSCAEMGRKYVITRIVGDSRFLSRITSVGLTEGCPLTVLQNRRKRPLLVYARDSMLALDRGDCENVEVEARQ